MVVFESDEYRVTTGWLYSWRVYNLMTGAILLPNIYQKERIGLAWRQVRGFKKFGSETHMRASEAALFDWFAHAVNDPSSLEGKKFLRGTLDELCANVAARASLYRTQ